MASMIREYFETPELWGRTSLTPVQQQVGNVVCTLCRELPEGSRVAEVGCGDGVILKSVQELCPHLLYYGIDLSFTAVRHLPSPLFSRGVADLTHMPFGDGSFEFSYCVDVLEHVRPAQLQQVVREIHRTTCGPVLMVAPFMESDAVRTVCPHCSCVFSPYYHHNRFTLATWDKLGALFRISRRMEYLPLGSPVPHIPAGLGLALVSSGNLAIHSHETICPQCGTVFSRPQPDSAADLTMLLAPYAARHRQEFGWIYEEMGILTIPHHSPQNAESTGSSGGILIQSRSKRGTSAHEQAVLVVRSAFEIDFGDPRAILPNSDLFRTPAYALDNGNLTTRADEIGVFWMESPSGGRILDNSLRLVFPPIGEEAPIRMELTFSTDTPGTLEVVLCAPPPYSPILIGSVFAVGTGMATTLHFNLPPDDDYVTPFGVLADLVWRPSEIGDRLQRWLKLHKIRHIDHDRESYPLAYDSPNEWPCEIRWFHQAALHFDSEVVKNIVVGCDSRDFNLIGLISPDGPSRQELRLPPFKQRKDLRLSPAKVVDPQLSESQLDSYRLGRSVYELLFERVVRESHS